MTVRELIAKLNREDLLDLDVAVCDEDDAFGSDFNIKYNDFCVFLEGAEWGGNLSTEPTRLTDEDDEEWEDDVDETFYDPYLGCDCYE